MPAPVDDDFTILVCACGKRLKAPGAHPGRVGRCPACGGLLRAPGEVPAAGEDSRRSPARTTAKTRKAIAPASANAGPPEDVNPSRIGTEIKRPRHPAGPVGREGLLRAPSAPEETMAGSLRYPLWDGNGLAILLFLPPTLWLTSMLSIGLVPVYVIDADVPTKMGALAMIFPMAVLLALTFGYLGTFLGEIVASSGFGEVYHPRVPPWLIGATLGSLSLWLGALAAGMMVSGPLWIAYRSFRESFGPLDWVVAALLAVPGAAYALMALLGMLLHGSLVAANPITVLAALRKTGRDGARMALIASASGVATAGAATLLFWLSRFGLLAVFVGAWAFWLAFVYEAMVLSRILGLFYRRHAARIGWFREHPRWGGTD